MIAFALLRAKSSVERYATSLPNFLIKLQLSRSRLRVYSKYISLASITFDPRRREKTARAGCKHRSLSNKRNVPTVQTPRYHMVLSAVFTAFGTRVAAVYRESGISANERPFAITISKSTGGKGGTRDGEFSNSKI